MCTTRGTLLGKAIPRRRYPTNLPYYNMFQGGGGRGCRAADGEVMNNLEQSKKGRSHGHDGGERRIWVVGPGR